MILSRRISWSITMRCCVKTTATKRWRAIIFDDLSARLRSAANQRREEAAVGVDGAVTSSSSGMLWRRPIAICNNDTLWHMNAMATCCCNSVCWDLYTAGAEVELRKLSFNYVPIPGSSNWEPTTTSRARVRCWNYFIFFVIITMLLIFSFFTPK